jgi:hypothetical protein
MGRTRRQNRKEPLKPYINCLPNELLLAIFIHFWALDYGSHHIFLQVCKRWHAVTQSTRIFWTKILCRRKSGRAILSYTLPSYIRPSYIRCSTPEALSKHLARIDGMKFELCFWDHADQILDWAPVLRIYIHKCHKISSLGGDSRRRTVTIANALLTELLMEYSRDSSSMEPCLHTIVYRDGPLMNFYDLTAIWNHLRALSLRRTRLQRNEKTQNFFSSLQNLRELSLDDIGDASWRPPQYIQRPRTLGLTMVIGSSFLINLSMYRVSLDWFHDKNYHNLVELSYSPIYQFNSYRGKILTLPRLRRLHVISDWGVVAYIRAPNIEAVELTQGYSWGDGRVIQKFPTEYLPSQALYLQLGQRVGQGTFMHVLSRLSISTLVYLRLEQDGELSVGLMQRILEYVKNGLSVRWNGVVVSGEPEQLATWVETGHLVAEV